MIHLKPKKLIYIPNVRSVQSRALPHSKPINWLSCSVRRIMSCQPITVSLEETLAVDWMSFVFLQFENLGLMILNKNRGIMRRNQWAELRKNHQFLFRTPNNPGSCDRVRENSLTG